MEKKIIRFNFLEDKKYILSMEVRKNKCEFFKAIIDLLDQNKYNKKLLNLLKNMDYSLQLKINISLFLK